ncbi:MAG: DsrE family protein [Acidobacteriota bacterium]
MKKKLAVYLVLMGLCLGFFGFPQLVPAQEKEEDSNRLVVLWSSGDKEVAMKMVFMYVYNGKKRGWWDEIALIVWGPSSKLLAGDKELQEEVKKMMEEGVQVFACKACSDSYGVSEKLSELDIEVKYMGVPYTEMLQGGWISVTF